MLWLACQLDPACSPAQQPAGEAGAGPLQDSSGSALQAYGPALVGLLEELQAGAQQVRAQGCGRRSPLQQAAPCGGASLELGHRLEGHLPRASAGSCVRQGKGASHACCLPPPSLPCSCHPWQYTDELSSRQRAALPLLARLLDAPAGPQRTQAVLGRLLASAFGGVQLAGLAEEA